MVARMTNPPIVLVPGFWLGAWAWDEVAAALRADGHDVAALTLPGLESAAADRSGVTLADHAAAIAKAARDMGRAVVLAVHSGASMPGYMASDMAPGAIAAMVYVDTFPVTMAMNPDFQGVELPLPPWDELTADPGNSIEGISPEQLATFRERAVPQPGSALRDAPALTNDARKGIPSTIVCCATPPGVLREAASAGQAWAAGIAELRDVRWLELPTGHWPMFSKPRELADIIGAVAEESGQAS